MLVSERKVLTGEYVLSTNHQGVCAALSFGSVSFACKSGCLEIGQKLNTIKKNYFPHVS